MFVAHRWVIGAVTLAITALGVGPVTAAETGALLPADPDLILTFHVRRFLKDHQDSEGFRRYLDRERRAALERVLGLDPTRDIDRITVALQSGGDGLLIFEGRFHQNRLRAALQQLAGDRVEAFKIGKTGELERWRISHPGGSIHLLLPDSRTLVIASSKKGMDGVLARARDHKPGGLTAGVRALLERASKHHVSLVTGRADRLAIEALRLLQSGSETRARTSGQIPVLQQYARGLARVGLGLTIGKSSLRLEFILDTKRPELAQQLRQVLSQTNFWAALALKAADQPLLTQLAGIIGKERVRASGAELVVQAEVPYTFLEAVAKASWLANLFPGALADRKGAADLAHQFLETVMRRITSIPLWGPPRTPIRGALEVVAVRDIAYRTDPQADAIRHRLDLFYPRGKKGFPVVVLVHGGGWVLGDNRCCGLYSSVGQFLAGQGIGVVLPNYRLSPWVKHPQHVRDVARAVAWTRGHIGRYGGDPRQLWLLGHSAGGHLVSLLATDESYLRAEGLRGSDIKGVISVSGVYRIPPGPMRLTLGGSGPRAIRIDQQWPLRGDGRVPLDCLLPRVTVTVDSARAVFGPDPRDRARASPLTHVRRGLPPFLLLISAHDLPTLPEMAEEFHRALRREGCDARLLKVARRNHNSLLFSAIEPEDPAARAILDFISEKK
jgi:acetyl esterase/lipase